MEDPAISEANSEPNPYDSPPTDDQVVSASKASLSVTRRNCVFVMYASMAIYGVVKVFAFDTESADFLFSILLAIMALYWALIDCRIRGSHFHGMLRVLYFIAFPLSVGLYLLITRRLLGIGLLGLHLVGFAVTFYSAFFAVFWGMCILGLDQYIDQEYFY